jgi:hypothetical protein
VFLGCLYVAELVEYLIFVTTQVETDISRMGKEREDFSFCTGLSSALQKLIL